MLLHVFENYLTFLVQLLPVNLNGKLVKVLNQCFFVIFDMRLNFSR